MLAELTAWLTVRVRASQRSVVVAFAGVLALQLLTQNVAAAPGDTLFSENFNGNLNSWTVNSSGGDANIDNNTAASGRSLELRWGTVSVTSDDIDASAAAGAQLSVWVRRGDDSFSEDPDDDEDFYIDYRDAGGSWQQLIFYAGNGTPGETFMPVLQLPAAALHATLSIRFRTTGNDGSDWDYWHVDDAVVTETALVVSGFGLDSCEEFESGLGAWTVSTSGGSASTSAQTAQSPSNALFTQGGAVTVTSPVEDLSNEISVELTLWVRRGDDAFSEDPDVGEDFVVEFLDDGGGWVQLGYFDGDGTPGQVYSLNYALPAAALHSGFQLRLRQVNGDAGNWDYWHTDDICMTGLSPILYSFEESVWTGSGAEVEEFYGSGLDGIAVGGANIGTSGPALTGNPGTCHYGVFDGANDYIEIADNDTLDISEELTVAAWINMASLPGGGLHTIVSKDTNFEYHINGSGQVFWWWNDSAGTTRSFTTSAAINLNQWHHVAITYESGSQVIYIDGVSAATQSFTGTLTTNSLPLFIGTDYNFISRAFDGLIDEVYIAPQALSSAEIVTLRDSTHPCSTASAQFSINHDTFGIHCVAETIVVDVIDSVAGTPRLDYNAQVQLDTQTGNGTWQLVTGGGVFSDASADDGIANYTWPLNESQAVFALTYPQGTPTMNIDVFQISDPGIRDTDAEGQLVFSASGFSVTAAALSNPPPDTINPFTATQTAAVPFNLHLAAYGQTPTDPECGIIETYTGNKDIAFWSTYNNPATGSVSVTVDGNAIAVNEAGAGAQTVTFSNGQAVVAAGYKDVGALAIALKDETTLDATQLPTGIRGATGSFVSRPANFVVSDIRNAAGSLLNPQAPDANGNVFVAAGAPFRATVTALDADGDATPNYGQETIAESVRLAVELVAPAGGADPAVSAATGFAGFSAGVSTATDLMWNEVGIMRVRAGIGDSDYLGAGDVLGAVSENIGRFVPNHFTVALNTPSFDTVCTAGGYTFTGEPFDYLTAPQITATARAVGGATALNYTGDFFRMSTTTLGARNYAAASGSLDLSGLPASGDPVVSEDSPGVALIVFDSGSGLRFERTTPIDVFNAEVSLDIDVLDSDSVAAVSNPVTFGGGSGIVFSNGPEFRYGRIRFVNAAGSELVNLPVGLFSEYYVNAATGFTRNTDDSCTTGVGINFVAFTEDLSAGETCVLDSGSPGSSGAGCAIAAAAPDQFAQPPAAGSFNLILAAPGAGNSGSTTLNATVPDWLQFDWDAGTPGDEDPSAQATFGIFGGQTEQIYIRELFN